LRGHIGPEHEIEADRPPRPNGRASFPRRLARGIAPRFKFMMRAGSPPFLDCLKPLGLPVSGESLPPIDLNRSLGRLRDWQIQTARTNLRYALRQLSPSSAWLLYVTDAFGGTIAFGHDEGHGEFGTVIEQPASVTRSNVAPYADMDVAPTVGARQDPRSCFPADISVSAGRCGTFGTGLPGHAPVAAAVALAPCRQPRPDGRRVCHACQQRARARTTGEAARSAASCSNCPSTTSAVNGRGSSTDKQISGSAALRPAHGVDLGAARRAGGGRDGQAQTDSEDESDNAT
jgi:hypothetical protein